MIKDRRLNEFSICLIPDDQVIEQIKALRHKLPPSPYRDDTPHITLLRGITSSEDLPDKELLNSITQVAQLERTLPLDVRVKTVTNMSNQFYSESGLLILESPRELLTLRSAVINSLSKLGYEIEKNEVDSYSPHMTVRLGVKLEGSVLDQAINLFQEKSIQFSKWSLFRLIVKDGSRHIHELEA